MIRIKQDEDLKNYGNRKITDQDEWSNNDPRDLDTTWEYRYKYESILISDIIQKNNIIKILELGCGPGRLGQIIQECNENIKYDFVDRFYANETFEKRKYKGRFFIKDLMNGFDISQLDDDYDLVIANDFLEHVANPCNIMMNIYKITKPNSNIFISVPNWRMGHNFIYRGLFDYDNFLYFCHVHGYKINDIYESPLKCSPLPKLNSESCMPDELLSSWNWYFSGNKLIE